MSEKEMTASSDAWDDEQLKENASTAMSPGRQLAAGRNAMGWSIELVASQLNLAPRQIQAIESDNYAALPGIATARGFVRAYAKLLKIDSAPIMAMIATEITAVDDAIPLRRALSSKPFSDNRLSPMKQRNGFSPKALFAVIAAIALLIGLFAAQRMSWISVLPDSVAEKVDKGLSMLSDSKASSPASASAGSISSSGQESTHPAPAAIQNISNSAVSAGTTVVETPGVATPGIATTGVATAGIATMTDAAAKPAAPTPASFSPSEAAQTAAATAEQQATDAGNALVLKLREDSWIEIKKPGNKTIVARLGKAGSTESFNLDGPISLTIGNARGVDATLGGAPLELRKKAKNNVARLNLKNLK